MIATIHCAKQRYVINSILSYSMVLRLISHFTDEETEA